jgi:two-component system, NarL family, response regulator DevR
MSDSPIRVFVVDDHETVRLGLQLLFDEEPDIDLAGVAATGGEGLEAVERTRPDVALLDLRLPDFDGIELCREIRSRVPGVRCLIFTAYSNEEAQLQAIVSGASGYLSKSDEASELIDAIRTVAAGGSLIEPGRAAELMTSERRATPLRPQVTLSQQQERVLDLIVEGLTNREISERLEISEKTVKNYVSVILDKLGVRSRTQAAILHERWRRDDPESDAS